MHNRTYHEAGWRGWLLGLAMIALSPAATAAPRVDFGHYAPGAPMVSLEIDDQALVHQVGYRDYRAHVGVAPGSHRLRVRSADGAVITERDLELAPSDSLVLFLAGDGRADLPYQLLVSYDHNHPIEEGSMTLQSTTLSVVRGAEGQLQPTSLGTQCGSLQVRWTTSHFANGTEGIANDDIGLFGGYSLSTGRNHCITLLASSLDASEPQAHVPPSAAGLRLREVISGNGRDYPLTIDYIQQAVEQTVQVVGATSAIDGLWFDPNNPGSGLLLAHAPTEADPHRVKAIIYGFGRQAQATWRVLDGEQILQFAGGDPDGTRAVVGVGRTEAEIRFHACDFASLRSLSGSLIEFTALPNLQFPRDVILLRKLLPAGCNPPGVG